LDTGIDRSDTGMRPRLVQYMQL